MGRKGRRGMGWIIREGADGEKRKGREIWKGREEEKGKVGPRKRRRPGPRDGLRPAPIIHRQNIKILVASASEQLVSLCKSFWLIRGFNFTKSTTRVV